jgi:hypothetical protein
MLAASVMSAGTQAVFFLIALIAFLVPRWSPTWAKPSMRSGSRSGWRCGCSY